MKQFKLDSKKKVWHLAEGKLMNLPYWQEQYSESNKYKVNNSDQLLYSFCGCSNKKVECDPNDQSDDQSLL